MKYFLRKLAALFNLLRRAGFRLRLNNLQSSIFNLQYIVFFSLLFAPNSFSQSGPVLARVGDNYISTDEFKYRFELSPHIFPEDETDADSIKLDFLYSIIAEKLWADEADKMGYADNEKFLFFFSPLKDMYVRDALFQKEILSKVNVSPEDIMNGIRKYSFTLDVNIISAADKNTIDTVFSLLSSGVKPDSLKSRLSNIAVSQQNLNFGDLKDEDLENKLYSLLPGMITSPVSLDDNYAIFYLRGKENKDIVKDQTDMNDEVKKIIKNRRTERQYTIYLEELLAGMTIKASNDLFYKFADEVFKALIEQKGQIENEGGSPEKFYLDETAVYKIKGRLGRRVLNKILFEVDNQEVTLSDFLAYFTLYDFVVENLDKKNVFLKLNKSLKTFIQLSVITREGYSQNLQNSTDVKDQLAMWRSNYLAQQYKNGFLDSVSVNDQEVYEYYLKSLKSGSGIKQVKVLEFRTDSLACFEKVFNEMGKGMNFSGIINELHSTDYDTEIKETEFFPVTANEIGRIADKMNIGEVYGPLKRFNKYEVFQLVAVKDMADSLLKKFDSVKDGIRQELIYKKMAATLTENTKELLSKYHVETNPQVLHDIKTSSLNMFVHRYMGFGGRIAAVPYTSPVIEFKKIRQIMQEFLP